MDFQQRYGLHELMKHHDRGILSHGLQDLDVQGRQSYYADKAPWLYGSNLPIEASKGIYKPAQWTNIDSFIVKTSGTQVYYNEISKWGSKNKEYDKVVGRYNADTILRKLRETKEPFSEEEIAASINHVKENCDLRRTTATSLPNLKSVGETLTLDTDSALENLSGLKKARKINVVAKNLKEMDKYLVKLGLMSQDGKILVDVADDIYLIMKNYL